MGVFWVPVPSSGAPGLMKAWLPQPMIFDLLEVAGAGLSLGWRAVVVFLGAA
jgi:hypothetical protein